MKTLKSIGAVLAGFALVVVLSMATDAILEAAGVFPPPTSGLYITWMLVLALLYRTVYTIAGGYLTATLAPDKPMRHAVILGLLGMVVGTLGAIANWDLSSHWYPIALVVEAVPCTWLGGKLRTSRQASVV
jgi:hypothetical protein